MQKKQDEVSKAEVRWRRKKCWLKNWEHFSSLDIIWIIIIFLKIFGHFNSRKNTFKNMKSLLFVNAWLKENSPIVTIKKMAQKFWIHRHFWRTRSLCQTTLFCKWDVRLEIWQSKSIPLQTRTATVFYFMNITIWCYWIIRTYLSKFRRLNVREFRN